jgi:hypothetical protein
MDAEEDRLLLGGKVSAPDPALYRLNPHPRDVAYVGHVLSFLRAWDSQYTEGPAPMLLYCAATNCS